MEKRRRLAWATTNYGPIDASIYQNHLAAIANAARSYDLAYVGTTDKMYTHTASNRLAEDAVTSCIDYVFFTENDMLLPFDIVDKLVKNLEKNNLDACSGLYFLRGDGTKPCLYKKDPDSEYGMIPLILVPENETFSIDCPGMGCVLIKTDTFRKMKHPWFDLKEGKYGQDIYFWANAWRAGIKVAVDTSVQCGHLCERRVVTIKDYKDWLTMNDQDTRGFVVTSPLNSATGGKFNESTK